MRLHEIIVQKAILTELSGRTKQEVFAELIETFKNAGRLTQSDVAVQGLLARERKGSSGIGQGVAIPHICTTAVHQPMIAFGKSRTGIDFQAIDGKPVNLVFLVLGRINGQGFQLKILGRLAHLFHMPSFLETLQKVESPREFLTLLKEKEENLGEIETAEVMPSVCVAGAGNGGLAVAGHLALVGCRVNLFNRSEDRISAIKLSGGIQVTGEVNGFAKLNLVTTDPSRALSGVDLIMVVIPATGHKEMARILGPHLVDGQVVVLNPGRTGGALEFAEALRQLKVS